MHQTFHFVFLFPGFPGTIISVIITARHAPVTDPTGSAHPHPDTPSHICRNRQPLPAASCAKPAFVSTDSVSPHRRLCKYAAGWSSEYAANRCSPKYAAKWSSKYAANRWSSKYAAKWWSHKYAAEWSSSKYAARRFPKYTTWRSSKCTTSWRSPKYAANRWFSKYATNRWSPKYATNWRPSKYATIWGSPKYATRGWSPEHVVRSPEYAALLDQHAASECPPLSAASFEPGADDSGVLLAFSCTQLQSAGGAGLSSRPVVPTATDGSAAVSARTGAGARAGAWAASTAAVLRAALGAGVLPVPVAVACRPLHAAAAVARPTVVPPRHAATHAAGHAASLLPVAAAGQRAVLAPPPPRPAALPLRPEPARAVRFAARGGRAAVPPPAWPLHAGTRNAATEHATSSYGPICTATPWILPRYVELIVLY